MSDQPASLFAVMTRLEDMREALQSQNRALTVMLQTQQTHGQILALIQEAVTAKPEGSPLADALAAIVDMLEGQGKTLHAIHTHLMSKPPS